MNFEIKAGKYYKLKHPHSIRSVDNLHIDYILDNPTDNTWECSLVVCRCWNKHKRRWFYYLYEYYTLAIYNDWNYKENE
ncbi:MAG: hypothetical protein M0R17_11500 [Candidatus Omnitrophica bacterium]|jgi:hypothetical protein|nr:hypothetical protein [Candidatus Omnitrophota bacterium]